jgi:uncharacterized protein
LAVSWLQLFLIMFKLPLFPLNTVLFPGMPIHLRIFEPRYLMMMQYCMEHDQPFGVTLIRSGQEAWGPLAEPHHIGCTARIIHLEKMENGNLNLVGLGDERFQILKLDHRMPYLVGEVEIISMKNSWNLEMQRNTNIFRERVINYLKLLSNLAPQDVDLSQIELPDDNMLMIYLSASLLQVPSLEKQSLLASDDEFQLISQVERLYKREIVFLKQMIVSQHMVQKAARLN